MMQSQAALDADLFLPEPEACEVWATVISVDDHLVEPPHMFEGRLPASLADRAPRIVETRAGHQVWEFEGGRYSQVGMNAVAGRRPETVRLEPFRFEQMRPGCFDVDARVADMDVNGVWASLNFPSQISGFCGRVFFAATDPALGAACVRAWNDWLFDEWACVHPDRIIPLGIAFLSDPAEAANKIRRNATRGFKAVALPERPHELGLPSLGTGTIGTRSSRPVWRRPLWSASMWGVRECRRALPGHPPYRSGRPSSGSCPSPRVPSGCGRAILFVIRTWPSP